MQNEEALRALTEGHATWSEFHAEYVGEGLIGLDGVTLTDLKLAGYDLSGVSFENAAIRDVEFNGANLQRSSLRNSTLTDCCLDGASMQWADLTRARLMRCQLRGARMNGVSLVGATLQDVNLAAAGFGRSVWGRTTMLNSQMSAVQTYRSHHLARSTIDVATLATLSAPYDTEFLMGCGVPSALAEAAAALFKGQRSRTTVALWRHGARTGELTALEALLRGRGIELSILDSDQLGLDSADATALESMCGPNTRMMATFSGAMALLTESEHAVVAISHGTVESRWLHAVLRRLADDVRGKLRRPPALLFIGDDAVRCSLLKTLQGAERADRKILEPWPWLTLSLDAEANDASLRVAADALSRQLDWD